MDLYNQSKGIANIDYDNNNMPRRIQFTNGNVMEYIYSAGGEKLRTIHRTAVANITVPVGSTLPLTKANTLSVDSTDYIGNFELGSGLWYKYYFNGGYCRIFSGKTNARGRQILLPLRDLWVTFHYYTQDHLGNNRAVVSENGTLEQVTHYYPFGGVYGDAGTDPDWQDRKYNGKELDRMHGLDWYDYGARNYDAAVPMWTSVDPLCEKNYDVSPYVYCGDNPVNAVDPDGRQIIILGSRKERIEILECIQKLTNDKLGVKQNGEVIIMSRGSKNMDDKLSIGTNLIFSTIDNEHTMRIQFAENGDGNSEHDVYRMDAVNGKGTDVCVNFDISNTPSTLTRDNKTGKCVVQRIPRHIALGHELIHGNRSMKGVSVNPDKTTIYKYKDSDGSILQTSAYTEELETVGLTGNSKYTENKLRKEQGLNERIMY